MILSRHDSVAFSGCQRPFLVKFLESLSTQSFYDFAFHDFAIFPMPFWRMTAGKTGKIMAGKIIKAGNGQHSLQKLILDVFVICLDDYTRLPIFLIMAGMNPILFAMMRLSFAAPVFGGARIETGDGK